MIHSVLKKEVNQLRPAMLDPQRNQQTINLIERKKNLFFVWHPMSRSIQRKQVLDLVYRTFQSPWGDMILGAIDGMITDLYFYDNPAQITSALQIRWPQARLLPDKELYQKSCQALLAVLRGEESAIPLRFAVYGSEFQIQVWQSLLRIPAGQTMSYNEVAAACNRAGAARATGSAVGHNPLSIIIPCHRVIQASGQLGGYRWHPERKRQLLDYEKSNPRRDQR